MTTLRQDILNYAEKNKVFESWELMQHLQKVRSGFSPSKATAMLEEMTVRGDLTKSPIIGARRPRFQYRRAVQ